MISPGKRNSWNPDEPLEPTAKQIISLLHVAPEVQDEAAAI